MKDINYYKKLFSSKFENCDDVIKKYDIEGFIEYAIKNKKRMTEEIAISIKDIDKVCYELERKGFSFSTIRWSGAFTIIISGWK